MSRKRATRWTKHVDPVSRTIEAGWVYKTSYRSVFVMAIAEKHAMVKRATFRNCMPFVVEEKQLMPEGFEPPKEQIA